MLPESIFLLYFSSVSKGAHVLDYLLFAVAGYSKPTAFLL